MVTVSADTNPPTLIDNNVEASVIQHLEVSIFPSADYDLQVCFALSRQHSLTISEPLSPTPIPIPIPIPPAAGDNESCGGDDACLLRH